MKSSPTSYTDARPATMTSWWDGDTCHAQLHPMKELHVDDKLRLARIDAAPNKTAIGKAAEKFAASAIPVGASFVCMTAGDYREKWGRLLADLWYTDPGTGILRNLNDELVTAKLAKYWDGEGPHPMGLADDVLRYASWAHPGRTLFVPAHLS